jgi:hypothetical protein
MRDKRSRDSVARGAAGAEEVLIECRLFDDLITERLCSLRRQELSAAWDCSCIRAKRSGAGPGSAARLEQYGLQEEFSKQKGREGLYGTG